jgi:hypothetical protein
MKSKFIFAALFSATFISAQTQFVREDSIPVFANSQNMNYAWTGGINYGQFSPIDLNQDGILDLFVFDRSGSKITTFINTGTPNQVSYVPAMQYVSKFPKMHDWVLLRDYNCDGKMDIFTSNASKVEVYKNISSLANGLQFQLVTPNILADLTPNSTHDIEPLNVSWIDIPAIRDVDGDGDLDVLNYGLNGYQVEYYRNTSEELYGTCDSLMFTLSTLCWGEFTESQFDASITLGTPCAAPPVQPYNSENHNALLHAGSCLECLNVDADNDQDILVGDLTNPHIFMIRNGGSNSYAISDSVDTNYPGYDTTMAVQIFGCGFHMDVDNDGKKDLLFSPNALNTAENYKSVWYYHNTGADNAVHAHFIQNNFLQDKMIEVGEVAYPVFFDYDQDGDKDLFIGNRGYYDENGIPLSMIGLWENTGTATAPVFTLKTRDFAGFHYTDSLMISGMAPTFGDLDGDGDADLIVGDVNGKLYYFTKNGGSDTSYVLTQPNYQGIDVGNFAAPQLVDVDRDGKLDLLVGEQSGNVNYYHNDGTTTNAVFTLTTPLFGNVIVTQSGFTTGCSVPELIDSAGHYQLLVGSERGFIYRYDVIDGNLGGSFWLTDSLYISRYEGGRVATAVTDLNGDGLMDVVVGNMAGGVSLFYGDNTVSIEEIAPSTSFNLFPNPATDQVVIETKEIPLVKQFFTIYDLSGKEIVQNEITQQKTTVNTTQLSNGIYICSMTGPKGYVVNRKLVISK